MIRYQCDCGELATWVRQTQFAGTHRFCDRCAKVEPDFGAMDGAMFMWTEIKKAPVYTAEKPFSKPEYILCAAIHFERDGTYLHQPKNITSGFVTCGWKHHNCFFTASLMKQEHHMRTPSTQGFLTSLDRFVGREEAAKIARKSGQLPKNSKIKDLFSENLW